MGKDPKELTGQLSPSSNHYSRHPRCFPGERPVLEGMLWPGALVGPDVPPANGEAGLDGDNDCDIDDVATFAQNFSGSA